MKFFVTGRSNNYQRVVDAFDTVEASGHEVTLRWTDLPMIKPYCDNAETAGQYSTQQIEGVCTADVYVLFAHNDGNGVFTEFGAALAALALQGRPRLFAIGDEETKSTAMFHYHPAIEWVDSIETVLQRVEN